MNEGLGNMPAFDIRQRLVPYKILAHLLYARPIEIEWLQNVDSDKVRVITGDAARAFRVRNKALWDALYWLQDAKLLLSVEKERQRGSCIVTLRQPTNIQLDSIFEELEENKDD